MPFVSRKEFLIQAAGASALIAANPRLSLKDISSKAPLGKAATTTLSAWCDLLVPGASEHGVGDFVNTQLAKRPDDALLGIRYFNWPPPWLGFYQEGVQELDRASKAAFGSTFVALAASRQATLLQRLLDGTQPWAGPPFFLFYLVTRSDAVDVFYGVASGYRRLGLPYNPLIKPRRPW